jgi:hypothetical protein
MVIFELVVSRSRAVSEEFERFREAAMALRSLDEEARRAAFGDLVGEVLPALEARARETADARGLIDTLAEIWQVGYDIGVLSVPPSR